MTSNHAGSLIPVHTGTERHERLLTDHAGDEYVYSLRLKLYSFIVSKQVAGRVLYKLVNCEMLSEHRDSQVLRH